MVDENKKAPKNIVELIYMINKLKPEEFIGVCKILGVEIYVEDLNEEKREVEMSSAPVPSEEESDGRQVHMTDEPNLSKTPRLAEDMIRDVVDKLLTLNRTQRRNLKKLLKAATKGEK